MTTLPTTTWLKLSNHTPGLVLLGAQALVDSTSNWNPPLRGDS